MAYLSVPSLVRKVKAFSFHTEILRVQKTGKNSMMY